MTQPMTLGDAWPGFTPKGTVILPVPGNRWPARRKPLALHGCRFRPKRELHVTLVGKALGARLKAAMNAGALTEEDLASAFALQTWRCVRNGRCVRLRKAAAPGTTEAAIESVIERIALPAMAGFHDALGRLLRESLPVPPAHVTLYTHGDDEGIGVPDEATLDALTVDIAG